MVSLGIKKLEGYPEDLPLPSYATPGSSGMDLYATSDCGIPANASIMMSTYLAFMIPEGYELQIRPRSGLAFKYGITVLNSPATIDSDFTGTVGVILINHGTRAYQINKGDRIAQLVLAPVTRAEITYIENLPDTVRGSGGFGHTGR